MFLFFAEKQAVAFSDPASDADILPVRITTAVLDSLSPSDSSQCRGEVWLSIGYYLLGGISLLTIQTLTIIGCLKCKCILDTPCL